MILAAVFGGIVGVVIGIGIAPTVYELHAAYWLARFDGEGE